MIEKMASQYMIALESENIKLRLEFINDLLECKTEECILFHLKIIQNRLDSKFYYMIRSSLKKRGNSVIPFLIDIVKNQTDSSIKADAIMLIGNLRYHEALPIIEKCLVSDNRDVRYAAIISLGWMGSEKQINILIDVYTSENDATLRGYAITALRQIFFNHKNQKANILAAINDHCLAETDKKTQNCIILSTQDIAGKNFGLFENTETGKTSGNIKISWLNLIEYFNNSLKA